MRRWYTNERIAGLQITVLLIAAVAIIIGIAWISG